MRTKTPAKDLLTKNNLHRKFWGRKIIAAEKHGGFTHKDEGLAYDWVTCACGKNHLIKIDDRLEGPEDQALNRLGLQFAQDVEDDLPSAAARTLIAIEKRAWVLWRKKKPTIQDSPRPLAEEPSASPES